MLSKTAGHSWTDFLCGCFWLHPNGNPSNFGPFCATFWMKSMKIQKLNWITCCIYCILRLLPMCFVEKNSCRSGIDFLCGCFWLHPFNFRPFFCHFLNEFNANLQVKLNNMLNLFYFRSTSNVFCQVKQLPEPNWFPMWLLLAASSWQSLQFSLEQSPNPLVILSPCMNSISRSSILNQITTTFGLSI